MIHAFRVPATATSSVVGRLTLRRLPPPCSSLRAFTSFTPSANAASGASAPSSSPSPSPSPSPSAAAGAASTGGGAKIFTGYTVFKRKGMLNVNLVPPTFRKNAHGVSLEREGCVMLTVAPANPPDSPSEYNWNEKVSFALDVNECGDVLTIDKTRTIEFLHDPSMGSTGAGQVSKKARFQPAPDGKALFFSLTHNDKNKGISNMHSVPLSWSEVEVIRSLVQFAVPRLLGMDKIFEQASYGSGSASGSGFGSGNPRFSSDFKSRASEPSIKQESKPTSNNYWE